ncbi:hypothetical protein PC117_g26105 [Phytophthora cactorum]|uniref:Uncharacterized protein n=1 Tax=Phytophthora cactorum TaxID=29920 RepID=A0A8T1AMJ8_9STRA|nr:hypothetical protein PC117_g26105 [Phytophthora cactorum]
MVAPAHPQTAPPYRDLVCAARRLAAQQATLMQNYLQPLLLFTPFWTSRLQALTHTLSHLHGRNAAEREETHLQSTTGLADNLQLSKQNTILANERLLFAVAFTYAIHEATCSQELCQHLPLVKI